VPLVRRLCRPGSRVLVEAVCGMSGRRPRKVVILVDRAGARWSSGKSERRLRVSDNLEGLDLVSCGR
jgi:hypothetical protein